MNSVNIGLEEIETYFKITEKMLGDFIHIDSNLGRRVITTAITYLDNLYDELIKEDGWFRDEWEMGIPLAIEKAIGVIEEAISNKEINNLVEFVVFYTDHGLTTDEDDVCHIIYNAIDCSICAYYMIFSTDYARGRFTSVFYAMCEYRNFKGMEKYV